MRKIKLQNEKGFSLLELMISTVITGVLVIFLMSLAVTQQKGLNTVISKYERTDLIQEIREILSSSLSCRATLGGLNPDNTAVGTILNIVQVRSLIDDGVNLEAANAALRDINVFTANANENLAPPYADGKVKFLGFSLSSAQLGAIANSTRGTTHLIIDTVTPESSYARRGGQTMRINVETDAAGNIVTCGVSDDAGLSLATMCSVLGGSFDPNGRGGAGNCFSLNLTGGLSVTGNVNVYPDPAGGDGGGVNLLNTVNTAFSFSLNSGPSISGKAFCDTLGGRFVPAGRAGAGDCRNMQLEGKIRLTGALQTTGGMNFLNGVVAPNAAVASSPLATTAGQICATLGGVYNPVGRNGNGDCANINSTTTMSISGDIVSDLPMNIN